MLLWHFLNITPLTHDAYVKVIHSYPEIKEPSWNISNFVHFRSELVHKGPHKRRISDRLKMGMGVQSN